jgi:hypothetical protein
MKRGGEVLAFLQRPQCGSVLLEPSRVEILELVIRTRSGREEDLNKFVNWVVE